MRFALTLSLLAAFAAAQASFELVMVADRGTKSVHRFDGSTGIYLGQFGQGYLQNPMSIALDQANGRVWVADQAGNGDGSTGGQVRMWSFNYSTGEYLSNFLTSFAYVQPQVAMNGANLIIGHDGGFADTYTTSGAIFGGSVNWSSIGSTTPKGLTVDGAGNVWAVDGNKVLQKTPAGALTAFTMASTVSASSPAGQRQLVVSGTRAMAVGALSWSKWDTSALNAANPANSISTFGIPTYLQLNGAGFGHGDIAYVTGKNSSTTGLLSRVLYSEGIKLADMGSGILVEPRSIAVVVAPEPASMLALGLGGLALVRRRRRV